MAACPAARDANDPAQCKALALRLLPLLDLTSLGEDDTPARIATLCAEARTPWGMPAAVCVYPEHIVAVRRALEGSGVRTATVVNFPDGGDDRERITCEIGRARAAGADEVDLVLPYRALLAGRVRACEALLLAAREACDPGTTLKLILETGVLASAARIRQASELGLAAGVDFLKTSTGKAAVNATPEAAAVMLAAIARAGGRAGFKAAGGVRRIEDAAPYVALAETILGAGWVTPVHFRIGASALLADLRMALETSA